MLTFAIIIILLLENELFVYGGISFSFFSLIFFKYKFRKTQNSSLMHYVFTCLLIFVCYIWIILTQPYHLRTYQLIISLSLLTLPLLFTPTHSHISFSSPLSSLLFFSPLFSSSLLTSFHFISHLISPLLFSLHFFSHSIATSLSCVCTVSGSAHPDTPAVAKVRQHACGHSPLSLFPLSLSLLSLLSPYSPLSSLSSLFLFSLYRPHSRHSLFHTLIRPLSHFLTPPFISTLSYALLLLSSQTHTHLFIWSLICSLVFTSNRNRLAMDSLSTLFDSLATDVIIGDNFSIDRELITSALVIENGLRRQKLKQ